MSPDVTSLSQALENRQRGRHLSSWTDSGPRLAPECWPEVTAPFSLSGVRSIYTIGSCFARNIEEHLARRGYAVPTLSFSVPSSEWPGRSNGIMNKFTPASIYQELEWTLRMMRAPSQAKRTEIAAEVLIPLSDGAVLDLELAGFRPVSRERGMERRLQLYDVARTVFEADAVVITFGLVEAWWDRERQRYIQQTPGAPLIRQYGDRFAFKQMRYAECLDYARKTLDLLQQHGGRNQKILVTTSPVPLNVTFTGKDVIVANSHAKSLLRTLCGELETDHPHVAYFPSYESATLSAREQVWEEDRVHVKDRFVARIVDHLMGAFFAAP